MRIIEETLFEIAKNLWPTNPDLIVRTKREDAILKIICHLIAMVAQHDQAMMQTLRDRIEALEKTK